MKHLLLASLAALLPFLWLTACAQNKNIQNTKTFNAMNNGSPTAAPTTAVATFGAGCYWCTEAQFQQLKGVLRVESGFTGGHVKNPTYKEVCNGTTGHAEVCQIYYDPSIITFDELLAAFWTCHDPTQLNRQGNDVGTQYRSGIYVSNDAQRDAAESSAKSFGVALAAKGFAPITTEIRNAPPFYYAEAYHQQYLAKNPNGYCGLGGTGVTCAIGTGVSSS